MDQALWYLLQASEMVGFLAAAGFILALHRMRTTTNLQIMVGFALVMFGTAAREFVVYYGGAYIWTATEMAWSAVARYVWVSGAILFVRAVTYEKCGEWAWLALLLASMLFASVV
jgi:hypothetical protein